MKKLIKIALLTIALMMVMVSAFATDYNEMAVPTEPFTWEYLASIAGAAAFTLLVVQFFKVPLDRVWRIPTRAFAYLVALVVMLTATAFTATLTPQSALLAAVNAVIAALTAMGAYEVTFAKLNA